MNKKVFRLTMLAALVAAMTGGCSQNSDLGNGSDVCPVPLGAAPDLVYPKPGATISESESGIIVYSNVTGQLPISVVSTSYHVDALPTAVPSPVPSPAATPPAGDKTWPSLRAASIRPLLRPRTYDVDATVPQYSCNGTKYVQKTIGTFTLRR